MAPHPLDMFQYVLFTFFGMHACTCTSSRHSTFLAVVMPHNRLVYLRKLNVKDVYALAYFALPIHSTQAYGIPLSNMPQLQQTGLIQRKLCVCSCSGSRLAIATTIEVTYLVLNSASWPFMRELVTPCQPGQFALQASKDVAGVLHHTVDQSSFVLSSDLYSSVTAQFWYLPMFQR